MSLLDYAFPNYEIQETPVQSVPSVPVPPVQPVPVQDTLNIAKMELKQKQDMIKKYHYDFTLSPMQNAYLEINSRFNGNCEKQRVQELISKYNTCLQSAGDGSSKCDVILDQKIIKSGMPFHYSDEIKRFPIYAVTFLPNINPSRKFNYAHTNALKKLKASCPNYYLLQNDPKNSETCYLEALDYWTVVTTNYLNSVKQPTNLDRSDRSDILRRYYFNDNSFEYPKYGTN
jgi:hypothetical protein